MSTFLGLCQDVRRECRISGTLSSVANQQGDLERIVEWVRQAWVEIQLRHPDWRWMRRTFTLQTVADDDTYVFSDATDTTTALAIARFSSWRLSDLEDPPRIYLDSAGAGNETWLIWTPWEHWKYIYRIGSQPSGFPAHITVDPAQRLVLGPTPNDVYVVTGDYYLTPQTLTADGDTPEMPAHYHQLIVYRAMEKYAGTEGAPEIMQRAVTEGRRILRALEANQLPRMRLAEPLA